MELGWFGAGCGWGAEGVGGEEEPGEGHVSDYCGGSHALFGGGEGDELHGSTNYISR